MIRRWVASAILLAGLGLFVPLPLLAQTSETTVPAQPVETLAAKPVIKKFGNWGTRCEQVATKPKTQRCTAFVDIQLSRERKERILYLGVGYMPDKANVIFGFAVTPLGTLLPTAFHLLVDKKTKIGGPYIFCAPTGCQAEIIIDAAQLAIMRNGKEMEVSYQLLEQGEVKFTLSLDGFKEAFDSIPKPKAAPAAKKP